MKYHINFEYGNQSYARWNYQRDEIIDRFIIPFVHGHVVMLQRKEGNRLVNMKSVTSMIIYKTENDIHPRKNHMVPAEFDDPSFSKYECTKEIIGEIMGDKMILPTRSLLQQALTIPEKKVFVIMQFGDEELDSVYELVIAPVIKSYGYESVRIDKLQNARSITDQVLEHIATSKFILSDLTGDRPNCYYETGFAHALGKELILTAKHPGDVHFDLQGYRFIIWKTAKDLRDKLIERFDALSKYQQPL